MKSLIATLIVILLPQVHVASAEKFPAKELLKEYRGSVQVPDDLYATYERLVRAMQAGDKEKIRQLCLPFSVRVTSEPRAEKNREYGEDMNIPFLKDKDGFYKYIRGVRKDSEDTYLVRTGSSYFYFVNAKTLGWRVYRYGDKPIE